MGGVPPPFWIIALLMLFLFSALSSLSQRSPSRRFAWQRDASFPTAKTSKRLRAQYFVPSGFEKNYPEASQQRRDLEHQVELDHIRNLQSQCEHEESRLWRRVMNARMMPTSGERQEAIKNAKAVPKRSCEKLESLRASFPKLFSALGRDAESFRDL